MELLKLIWSMLSDNSLNQLWIDYTALCTILLTLVGIWVKRTKTKVDDEIYNRLTGRLRSEGLLKDDPEIREESE